MKKLIILTLLSLTSIYSCKQSASVPDLNMPLTEEQKARRAAIIEEHFENDARKQPLGSQEYHDAIDRGLAKDSTIAYLWQQKAMPLYKQGQYDLATHYIDKAVKFDRNNEWLEYRAFMKCIFSKDYLGAIEDFEKSKAINGNSFVMDHSYDTYIAMSKLMLKEFAEAEQILTNEVDSQMKNFGEVHHLVLFYLGISKYEQGKNEEAITAFDKCLKASPLFPEPYYYKGFALRKMDKTSEGDAMIKKASELSKDGNSFSEDNAIYERYPYQVWWKGLH